MAGFLNRISRLSPLLPAYCTSCFTQGLLLWPDRASSYLYAYHGREEGFQRCRVLSQLVPKSSSQDSKEPVLEVKFPSIQWWDDVNIPPPPKENVRVLEEWGMLRSQVYKVVKGTEAMYELDALKVEKKLQWLETEFNLTRDEIVRIVGTYPPFLSKSIKDEVGPFLNTFIKDGFSKQVVGRMVKSIPWVLGAASNFEPFKDFLKESLAFSDKEVMTVLVKAPGLLRFTIEENVKPKVDFFLGFGLQKIEVKNMVKDYPKILRTSLDKCLKINLEELRGMQIDDEGIRTIVKRCPQIITRHFDRVVQPKVEWLKNVMGFNAEELLDYFMKKPNDFLANLETWKASFEWVLGMYGDGGKRDDALQYLKRNPTFISYRSEGLNEKYLFARSTLKKSTKEIFSCPQYLLESFQSKILLRTAFLLSKNQDPAEEKLSHLVSQGKQFCMAYDVEEYKEAQGLWSNVPKSGKLEAIETLTFPWVKPKREVPYEF